jgi:segregation and condensation protein B
MESNQLKYIVEAVLLAAGRPLNVDEIEKLFGESDPPARQDIRAALMELQSDYADRGISLTEVASGFRIQVDPGMSRWLEKLWEERAPRYSRALMETMAIIAYRQPVTRGDVEDIRGVGVTTNIIRTLLERNWIRVVGHRDVPGKPAMFGTTKEFLDYFGLKKLDELPPLEELKDFDKVSVQLDFPDGDEIGPGIPPGAATPLIHTHGHDDAQGELATVSSIETARAAAETAAEPPSSVDRETRSATVVPLKTS